MAKDTLLALPRVGDRWTFKPSGDGCKVDRVYRRRGIAEPIVDVVHPLQILHERRLSWFLKNYAFTSSAGVDDVFAAVEAIRAMREV